MRMICKECDNEGFDEGDDGFFYCQRCFVRAEDMIQTAVDEDDLMGRIYQPKNIRRKVVTPINPEPIKAVYEQTRDRYVHGFLKMITYQCDALVEKFNVTAMIIGLVGPMCLRYVTLSGVYDDDIADKAITDSEILQSAKAEAEEKEVNNKKRRRPEEVYNLNGKRAITIWKSLLRKSLPISSSLAISFLVCHHAGKTILPTDFVRWAEEGKIPYRSAYIKMIQEEQQQMGLDFDLDAPIVSPQIVSAQSLEAQAASIADMIGLPLNPVDFNVIASNYLNRLSIPPEVNKKIIDMMSLWVIPSPDLYLSMNKSRLPTRVSVMSILIVAIRLLYNINGFGVWERSLDLDLDLDLVVPDSEDEVDYSTMVVPDSEDEVDYANLIVPDSEDDGEEEKSSKTKCVDADHLSEFDTMVLLKNLETKYYEVAAAPTLDYEKDLLSYLLHGKNELFPVLSKKASSSSSALDNTYTTIDNLWNGYQEEPDDLSLDQLHLNDENLRDGNNTFTSTSHSRKTQESKKSKESAIKRLVTNMEENLFHYIPPRVKVKRQGYLQYVRHYEDGVLRYSAHADYYILLRVCALIAEIDVKNMHRGVLSFERRLDSIEKRIDQILHQTPPSSQPSS